MFNHSRFPEYMLERDETTGRRLYLTPEGNKYPSVTTVVGWEDDKSFLEDWKKRVGEEEALRISRRATHRGTDIHLYCEDYLNNKVPKVSPFDLDAWRAFRPVIDRIDNVRALEGRMYSDKLKLAGTVDCVGDFDGKKCIIDFKTSKRLKTKEEIGNYFLQASAYSWMVYERYGEMYPNIAILMSVDDHDPLIFMDHVQNHMKKLFATVKKYHETVK